LKKTGSEFSLIDETSVIFRIVLSNEIHKQTFLSNIDGSVQYYAINPAQDPDLSNPKSLVLSVHGAGVEATNQANSYYPKTWAHIVAPTNRRPYGYNWEDWGRLDALEVLTQVQDNFIIDPNRIYLTGHSMGGHGTWHLGAMYPDKWAAIGPSAGWISFSSYRFRQEQEEKTPIEELLMRVTNPSDTYAFKKNYNHFGIYIIHGSKDDNVPPQQSRQMVEHLNKFHKDFIYYEQEGAGHWWDNSDEPGADCVDWAPLFDFFARHAVPGKEQIREVNFTIANPGISAWCNWLGIEAQQEQLKLSTANVRFDPGKNRFIGKTENVSRLAFDLCQVNCEKPILIELDDQKLDSVSVEPGTKKLWLTKKDKQWIIFEKPSKWLKGPHRYGTFKDVFKNRVVFVYGTKGNKKENQWAYTKARYDAECFWYQGNASIDIIADINFDPQIEVDRNVVLYGNANTNSVWKALLGKSPVQIKKGIIKFGKKNLKGEDLACLFLYPRPGSDNASVAAVSGTGILGMRLTNTRPYLYSGFGYPDCLIFSSDVFDKGINGVLAAGFFGLDWDMDSGDFVWNY
jgi:pimeloyl-ACP methyl ester carboxylesterase